MSRGHVWFSVEHCVSKLEDDDLELLRRAMYTPMQLVAHDEHSGEYVLRSHDRREFRVRAAPTAGSDALSGVPDLLLLSDFSEPSLLHTLRVRYERDDVYTFVGSILISINPYRWIDGLYDVRAMLAYRDAPLGKRPPHLYAVADAAYRAVIAHSADSAAPGGSSTTGAPAAPRNQAIVISGESGAGKTEATKIILQYLAQVTALDAAASAQGGAPLAGAIDLAGFARALSPERPIAAGLSAQGEASSPGLRSAGIGGSDALALGWLERRVLDANPLLEALGNARTLRNHNSSRFGKWIQIQFDAHGRIAGARVSNYLLEKTRVARQAPGEANYHLFYQLVNSADEGDARAVRALAPTGAARCATFGYLQHGSPAQVASKTPMAQAGQLAHTRRCLASLGFSTEEEERLLAMLGAVLNLGNVGVQQATVGGEHAQLSEPGTRALELVASGLRVPLARIEAALLSSATLVAGERIERRATVAQAEDRRDALAKGLYSRLFVSLVNKLNQTVAGGPDGGGGGSGGGGVQGGPASSVAPLGATAVGTKENARGAANGVRAPSSAAGGSRSASGGAGGGWIGILDIYGFECMPVNGFEQLLINYANEALQRHFNLRIFEAEQEEYSRERILWEHIAWADNSACVHLIDGRPGDQPGILATFEDGWTNASAATGAKGGAKAKGGAQPTPSGGAGSESAGADAACSFATDRKLLAQLHAQFGGAPRSAAGGAGGAGGAAHERYGRPRHDSERSFVVRHYAGEVVYTVDGFCERNAESLVDELRALMRDSECGWVRELFTEQSDADCASDIAGSSAQAAGEQRPKPVRRGASRLREQSVGSQFKEQLAALTKLIDSSRTLFVRCVCANNEREPQAFDASACVTQLKYAGMHETVRIRAAGYPVRLFVDSFSQRFAALARTLQRGARAPGKVSAGRAHPPNSKPGKRGGGKAAAKASAGEGASSDEAPEVARILRAALHLSELDLQVGVSKVFLRQHAIAKLERAESLRDRVAARTLQCAWRACLVRRSRNTAALALQAAARGLRARLGARARRRALVRVQAGARARTARGICKARRVHSQRRDAGVRALQAVARGRSGRKIAAGLAATRAPPSAATAPLPASRQGLGAEAEAAEAEEDAQARSIARLRPALPVTLKEGTSVLEAAKAMAAKRADAALVLAADGSLAGIITDTDVSRRVVAKSLDAATLSVGDAMTRSPKTVSSNQSALHALRTMVSNHFRHLPVVDEGAGAALVPTGLLDLTKCLYDAISKLERAQQSSEQQGSEVMGAVRLAAQGLVPAAALRALLQSAAQVFAPTLAQVLRRSGGAREALSGASVRTNANVREASQLMSGARRAVVVLDEEGAVAGILTSRDVLFRVVAAGLSADTTNVTSVMTPSPDCASPSATILETLHTMHDNRYQHMPVVSEAGELLGIVDALQLAYVALTGGEDSAGADAFWESTLQLPLGAADSASGGGGGSDVASNSEAGTQRTAHTGTGPLCAGSSLAGASALASVAPTHLPALPVAAMLVDDDEGDAERTVARLRPNKAVTLGRGVSVLEAAKAMAAKRADAALVLASDGSLAGIITDTDVSRRVVAKSLDAATLSVNEAMTRSPKTVSSNQSALHALRTMVSNHFRHLPVVDEGAGTLVPTGLLDLTKCLYDAISKLERAQQSSAALDSAVGKVRSETAGGSAAAAALEALLRNATRMFAPTLAQVLERSGGAREALSGASVRTNANVREASQLMSGARRAVVVLDEEGAVAGILTSRDVLFRVVAAGLSADTTNVTSVMTPSPDCASPSATILETLHTMHDHRYQHMPVVSEAGELLGIVDALQLAYHVLGRDDGQSDGFWESALRLPGNVAESTVHSASSAPWQQHAGEDGEGESFGIGRCSRANSIAPHDSVSAVGGRQAGHALPSSPGRGADVAEFDTGRFVFKIADERGVKHRATLSSFSLKALRAASAEALQLSPEAATRLRFTYTDTDGDPVSLSTDASVAEAVELARAANWTHILVQTSFASAGGWLSLELTEDHPAVGPSGVVPVTREAAKAQKTLFGGIGAMMGLAVVGTIAMELLKRN